MRNEYRILYGISSLKILFGYLGISRRKDNIKMDKRAKTGVVWLRKVCMAGVL
jgi:hypothetical protein